MTGTRNRGTPLSSAGLSARQQVERSIRALLEADDLKRAATEALRAYGPDVLRYLHGMLREDVSVREVFSAFAERLWRGLPAYRGEASVRTWAFQLAWNALCDFRKEAWRGRTRRLETEEAAELAVAGHDRTKSWLRLERQRLTFEALRLALSPEDQTLLQLRIDERLSWAECAEVLGRKGRSASTEALTKRFERIKARLGDLARDAS